MAWAVLNQQIGKALQEVLRSRSDRVVAVAGGAIVDEALYRALQYRMRNDPGIIDSLYEPDKPLGAFGARIGLAYLLYVIDKPTRDAMSGLQKVRNAFAHHLDINFRSPIKDLQKGMARLSLHEQHKFYPLGLWGGPSVMRVPKPKTPRSKFIVNMRIMMALLMADFNAHLPYTNAPNPIAVRPPSPYRPARPTSPQT